MYTQTVRNNSGAVAQQRDEILEPYEGKLSRTVLRRESGSNPADLVDTTSKPVLRRSSSTT